MSSWVLLSNFALKFMNSVIIIGVYWLAKYNLFALIFIGVNYINLNTPVPALERGEGIITMRWTKKNFKHLGIGMILWFHAMFINKVAPNFCFQVVSTPETSQSTTEAMTAWGKAMQKHVVHCTDTPGFIVNRVFVPYLISCVQLYERGKESLLIIKLV